MTPLALVLAYLFCISSGVLVGGACAMASILGLNPRWLYTRAPLRLASYLIAIGVFLAVSTSLSSFMLLAMLGPTAGQPPAAASQDPQ